MVGTQPVVLARGASGLVQAGLIPRTREGQGPDPYPTLVTQRPQEAGPHALLFRSSKIIPTQVYRAQGRLILRPMARPAEREGASEESDNTRVGGVSDGRRGEQIAAGIRR
jgi:hypothetical protein